MTKMNIKPDFKILHSLLGGITNILITTTTESIQTLHVQKLNDYYHYFDEPNDYCLSSTILIIIVCFRNEPILPMEDVNRIFEIMKTENIRPTVQIFDFLFHQCCQRKKVC
jgi:hypothetical protein